eukprot:TRINITY_DN65327_c0_g1_i1.p1 TRINITY_DN65327_c0_g1~~TRINITY_DN65327_c0_g1_i1.p1  ORF type:complete len:1298 (-),score=269.62 TRINITY_DN65327_c0_g1_i1:94-3987(-)
MGACVAHEQRSPPPAGASSSSSSAAPEPISAAFAAASEAFDLSSFATPEAILARKLRACVGPPQLQGCNGGRKFSAFLSHYKKECALEARFLQGQLESVFGFGAQVFVDTEELQDMRLLLSHVRESDCILVLLSSEVLTRPWCILELCTAIEAAVPIVVVDVRGKGFDATDGRKCLTFLDTELDRRNPGAADCLRAHGLTPLDAAYLLSNVIPNIPAVDFDPSDSPNVLYGCLMEIIEHMRNSSPVLISTSKLEWVESRDALLSTLERGGHHGGMTEELVRATVSMSRGHARLPLIAPVAAGAPSLPKAYVRMAALEDTVKAALLAVADIVPRIMYVHGPSGSGKSVFATAIAHDQQIRGSFEKAVYLCVSHASDVPAVLLRLLRQLSHTYDGAAVEEGEQGVAKALLAAAASCPPTLLIIDGVTSQAQLEGLCGWLAESCARGDACRALITGREAGFAKKWEVAQEISMPLLPDEEAASLLLEAGGASRRGPTPTPVSDLAIEAAKACEKLPLALLLGGGLLEHLGGPTRGLSQEYVDRLRGVPSNGSNSLCHLPVFMRLIDACLACYTGSDGEDLVRVFYTFAAFPENASVPVSVLEAVASVFDGSDDRLPATCRQVRFWLTTLLRMGLLQGSLSEGVYQHPVIRDYALENGSELVARQRRFVEAFLAARPVGGWPPSQLGHAGEPCNSVPAYVARYAWWHIAGAFGSFQSAVNGSTSPTSIRRETGIHSKTLALTSLIDDLLLSDPLLAEACVKALDFSLVERRIQAAEVGGKALQAAKILKAYAQASTAIFPPVNNSKGKDSSGAAVSEPELLKRALKLLDKLKSDANNESEQLELEVLGRLAVLLPEGEEARAMRARRQQLVEKRRDDGGETAEDALVDSLSYCADAGSTIGCFEGKMYGKKVEAAQITKAIELWVIAARRCVDAAALIGDTDATAAGVARFVGIHHLATMWGVGGCAFLASGILKDLGGPDFILTTFRKYDHHRDHHSYHNFQKLNVVLDCLFLHPLLSLGLINEACECIDKASLIWAAHLKDATKADRIPTRTFHAHELWLLSQSVLPALVRLRLWPLARKLASSLGLTTWNSSTCRIIWEQAVRTWSGPLGGEAHSFTVLQMFLNLQAFLIEPEAMSRATVKAMLEAHGNVLELSDTSWDHLVLDWAMLETAALAVEALGDNDDLAIFYATAGLERYSGIKPAAQASLIALQSRVATRAGNPVEAQELQKQAMGVALEAKQPLLVVSIAEGKRSLLRESSHEDDMANLVEKAAQSIGRPSELLERDFSQAREAVAKVGL